MEVRKLKDREIFHLSIKSDWMTPQYIIEAARVAMGGIDCDPASSLEANKRILASAYYDKERDGLAHPWFGRVWLNPPYGRGRGNVSNAALWSRKLLIEYQNGHVSKACLLVKAAPSERWFQPLLAFPVCFTRGRVAFLNASGKPVKGNAHGSAIVALGMDARDFSRAFREIGPVVRAIRPLSGV